MTDPPIPRIESVCKGNLLFLADAQSIRVRIIKYQINCPYVFLKTMGQIQTTSEWNCTHGSGRFLLITATPKELLQRVGGPLRRTWEAVQ